MRREEVAEWKGVGLALIGLIRLWKYVDKLQQASRPDSVARCGMAVVGTSQYCYSKDKSGATV